MARNPGVAFDQEVGVEIHVKNIMCDSVMTHLRNTIDIRTSLTQYTTDKLVYALVTSYMDNENALLCGIPAALLNTMQRVQNTAARVVSGCQKQSQPPRLSREYTSSF